MIPLAMSPVSRKYGSARATARERRERQTPPPPLLYRIQQYQGRPKDPCWLSLIKCDGPSSNKGRIVGVRCCVLLYYILLVQQYSALPYQVYDICAHSLGFRGRDKEQSGSQSVRHNKRMLLEKLLARLEVCWEMTRRACSF